MKPVTKGRRAEELVCRFLLNQGWRIQSRNYRRHGFELDIVAARNKRLLVAEVRYRKDYLPDTTQVYDIISRNQVERIISGTNWYISQSDEEFDQVEIDLFVASNCKGKRHLYRYRHIHSH